MKKPSISVQLLVTNLQVLMIAGSIFADSAVMGQTRPKQLAESRMPDEFQLAYHVGIKDFTSEAEQRAMFERQSAYSRREAQAKKKDGTVSQQEPFPGLAPDRRFDIRIAQSQQKFYWASDEKINPSSFIYDGKRSYYYDRIGHRMYVHACFRLMNGMTLPLPGCSLANIPMVMHASQTTPGRIDGEIYTGGVDIQDKPSYIPGRVEINAGNSSQIDRALCYIGAKRAVEHIFSEYVNIGVISVPRNIVMNMYNLQTEEQRDVLYLESKFQLKSSSLSSPSKTTFDPIALLQREKEGNNPSPEFVQWYSKDGREVTFIYKPGRSLEDQAGIEDYQEKKAVSNIENGKVDPRNYVGLGLLLFLLAMAGWKVKAALTGRRKS